MDVYIAVNLLDSLYKHGASFEDKVIAVMKIQSYTTKQGQLFVLEQLIKKQLEVNSKKVVKDMLIINYGYSKSGAYKLIGKVVQKISSKMD